MDQSQAVVPGATVLLIDESSGDTRRTVSNSEGYFSFAAVQAKTYKVRVEMAGFQAWERVGIEVHPGDKLSISGVILHPGAQSETVTVSAESDQIVPLDTGEKSALITAAQIQNLAIVGRSAAELLKILPGMTPITGAPGNGLANRSAFNGEVIGINGNGEGGKQSALGNFAANGTRVESMDIVSDGAHVSDPGCNCATPVNPNPDMIAEFKVLQSNFSAENSKGPVVIHAVTKSGGSEFHGTGYYYLRDYHLNSNEWLLNSIPGPPGQKAERVKNKFHFPGFNIGGPVIFPGSTFNKNRDKLFFFAGFEYMKQRLDTGVLQSIVPTEAMRRGDFSDAAYMSALTQDLGYLRNAPTGTGINNGIVPAPQFDRGGQVMLNLLPLPNVHPSQANGFNYVQAIPVDQNLTQLVTRIDYSISNDTKLYVRYNRQAETQPFPVGLWWRNPYQVPYPSSVVAENRSRSASGSLTQVLNPTLTNEVVASFTHIDFPNRFEDPQKVSRSALGYPYQGLFKNGLDQIPSITTWNGAATLFNPGGFDPVLFARTYLISVGDNISKVHGTHTTKFGAFWEQVTNNAPGSGDSNGRIEYATWHGNSTGNSYADLLTGQVAQYYEQTKNVLHNIGFRTFDFYGQDSWKVTPRFTLEYGARFAHLGNWYDRQGIGLGVFDIQWYDRNAPADSLTGVYWHGKDSAVPLSGNPSRTLFLMPRVGAAYDLFGQGNTVVRGGFGVFRYHDARQPYDSTIDTAAGVRNANVCCGTSLAALETLSVSTGFGVSGLDPRDKNQPVTYSWSFTIQQKVGLSTTLEAAYVGNKSKNLMNAVNNNGFSNINFVPFGAMLSDPDGDQQQYRALPQYGDVRVFTHNLYQNYNGLQVLLNRQKGRIGYMASYTFSKNLGVRGTGFDETGGNSSFTTDVRREAYGVLGTDRTHVFNISYNFLLPEFAKNYLGNSRVARAFLDGWQFSGISTAMSGPPLQTFAANFNMSGTQADGSPVSAVRLTGSPQINAQPILTCDPREGLSSDQLMNPNCFALPAPGRKGTYIFPYIKGPKFQNHDLSLFKNFVISEHKKIQFRFSAYNFVNHPLRSLTTNNLNLLFENGKLSNKEFGLLPNNNKFGKRIIQLAIKYYF